MIPFEDSVAGGFSRKQPGRPLALRWAAWPFLLFLGSAAAAPLEIKEVEGQPLAANVERVIAALEYLGAPFPSELTERLGGAARERDSRALQELMDERVLVEVQLNPEVRVKAARGPAQALLQQAGYTPFLIKVINESTSTQRLNLSSPQAGPVYAGVAKLSMARQRQEHLRENENAGQRTDRFLDLEMFRQSPMTEALSGLAVEYVIGLCFSAEAGRREATLQFDVGEGTQDLGFRGELPLLFDIRPAIPVQLEIRDTDGSPTTARLLFRDRLGHVYPPQPKRLSPDFFFQKQIYRRDGQTVLLPPGSFTLEYGRGPEYRVLTREIEVPKSGPARLSISLERWVDPMRYGFYSGDHHIHAAGCAHYTSPTEGVAPPDMFQQVKGEGLNVGCILTWGPCFDYQKQFFEPGALALSEPLTLLKYDIEVSGFGSQALGHVCLLNLKEQIYPGATGSKDWPTWTTPVLRWAKAQGAVTGYAHSGSGLQINPSAAAKRLLAELDADRDLLLSREEASRGLLPEPGAFEDADSNKDQFLSEMELTASADRAADLLPNFAIPELNSVGAQEIFVTTPQGLCDFISAMDTARLLEWNCWYHLLNCGFPLKVSGETDFPCMSSTRVGQGRVYVQLGRQERIDFTQWCAGVAQGRSYVSDGYAHALQFEVGGEKPGGQVHLAQAGTVSVRAKVAFGPQIPPEPAYGSAFPLGGLRFVGDTVNFHEPDPSKPGGVNPRGKRLVEIMVNGWPAASATVPADGREHDLEFQVQIDRSSWVALRHFPQLHTNPVNVLVGQRPIRASRKSALWSIACIEQLWRSRGKSIAESEREEALRTFQQAIETYRQIAREAPEGS